MTPEQKLSLVLYGQLTDGPGPFPEGPISRAWKLQREKNHLRVLGENPCPVPRCPVCKTNYTIKI